VITVQTAVVTDSETGVGRWSVAAESGRTATGTRVLLAGHILLTDLNDCVETVGKRVRETGVSLESLGNGDSKCYERTKGLNDLT
jgi:ACT domain-containing protein